MCVFFVCVGTSKLATRKNYNSTVYVRPEPRVQLWAKDSLYKGPIQEGAYLPKEG